MRARLTEAMLANITPLILTYNEAPNIGPVLERLTWARDIVVVDSFSNDETLDIVARYPQARVVQREFDNFANQCNFGLTETNIETEWVLSLDADYLVTPELVEELDHLAPVDQVGFRTKFVYCIYGRSLRSGIYPPVTVLFRKSKAVYRVDGHAHRVVIDGQIEDLRSLILHDDRKSLGRWFQAQSRYTKLEAVKILSSDPATLGWTDRIRRWRVVAPAAVLFYCLVLRGGILDGWAGFYYAFQRGLAELMLSLYLLEHDLGISEFGCRIADLPAEKGEGADGRGRRREQVADAMDGRQAAGPGHRTLGEAPENASANLEVVQKAEPAGSIRL